MLAAQGRRGPRCEAEETWRCNADDGRYLWSRCAGECDTRRGYCYCGARSIHPDRPLLQCEPIGIEKLVSPWKVDPRNGGERFAWEAIYGRDKATGKGSWCDANASTGEQPAAHCACRYDGRDGYLCQHTVAMFCLNQCTYRGTCVHGFCVCDTGWWGIDCSIPTTTTAAAATGGAPRRQPVEEAAAAAFAALPPPKRATGGETSAAVGDRTQASVDRAAGGGGAGGGPTPTGTGAAGAAASSVPPLRPLIYVYEMPPRFTTAQLERRHDKMFCAHRTYLQRNRSQYAYGIYQGYVLEVMLHEWLLASPHRTHDPSVADWFYVPVYATCAMVTAIFTTPETVTPKYRAALAADLYVGAHAHVMQSAPYWNRTGGKDHIWTFGYDEGGCFAPAPLWPSLIISHWGNTMTKHNRCTTTYDADRWDPPSDPHTGLPLSSLIGGHPCYDPKKDLILPSFRELTTFLPPDARKPPPKRRRLFFFSGEPTLACR